MCDEVKAVTRQSGKNWDYETESTNLRRHQTDLVCSNVLRNSAPDTSCIEKTEFEHQNEFFCDCHSDCE